MRKKQDAYMTTKIDIKEEAKDLKETTSLIEPRSFKGTDWKERIDKAKAAREFGRRLRKGKPLTLQNKVSHRSPTLMGMTNKSLHKVRSTMRYTLADTIGSS